MELTDLIKQLAEKIESEESRELFLESINELGEDVSVDDVLGLYENIGNANNELDSNSAEKALDASGLKKAAEGSVDPLHAKMNSKPKEKQDASQLGKEEEVLAGDKEDTKLDSHAAEMNSAAKTGQDSSSLSDKKAVEDKGKSAPAEPAIAKVNAIAKENIKQGRKLFKENIDITEDIDAIFEGTDLTEEFKEKAQLIFETAIKVKLDEHMEQIEESVADIIGEEIEAYKSEVSEQLEKYLDYVVEEFMTENEVAITSGIKVEIAESMFEGFKTLLSDHNIDVSEEKMDLVDGVISENEELVESYNKEVEKNITLQEELRGLKREKVVAELTEGLTAIEADNFTKLIEGVEFKDEESFVNKISILVDAYSTDNSSKAVLTEGIDYEDSVEEETLDVSSDVKRVLSSLDRFGKKVN